MFISGSGPPGAVLAIHLKKSGLNVLLCGTPRRFDSLEGMTEHGRLALQASHCEHTLAVLGSHVFRQSNWSDKQFGGNHEYLVKRSLFDVDARRVRAPGTSDQFTNARRSNGVLPEIRYCAPLFRNRIGARKIINMAYLGDNPAIDQTTSTAN